MNKNYSFVTIGYDCSPAAALRDLNLRNIALPFDWVVSNIKSIELCLYENFTKFHKKLYLNDNKKRLIDEYGFQFPHDYPTTNAAHEDIGEGKIPEENNSQIVNNWIEYQYIVIEKYKRRIERFLKIFNDPTPVIVLSRYNNTDIIILRDIIKKVYKKENIVFINSNVDESYNFDIININTEKNGVWNESKIWNNAITEVLENHPYFR